jgi:hypothetical protein
MAVLGVLSDMGRRGLHCSKFIRAGRYVDRSRRRAKASDNYSAEYYDYKKRKSSWLQHLFHLSEGADFLVGI